MIVEIRTSRLLLRAALPADAPMLATLTGDADPTGERLARAAALVENSQRWHEEYGYGL